jgi:hypothetical protein
MGNYIHKSTSCMLLHPLSSCNTAHEAAHLYSEKLPTQFQEKKHYALTAVVNNKTINFSCNNIKTI